MKKLKLLVLIVIFGLSVPSFGMNRLRTAVRHGCNILKVAILSLPTFELHKEAKEIYNIKSSTSKDVEAETRLNSLIEEVNNSNNVIKGRFANVHSPLAMFDTILLPYQFKELDKQTNLKGILQHEIGHIKHKDSYSKLIVESLTPFIVNHLIQVLKPIKANNLSILRNILKLPGAFLILSLSGYITLSFRRYIELKADDNIEPKYIPMCIDSLKKEKQDEKNIRELLSTHPSDNRRIRRHEQCLAYANLTPEEKQQKEDNYNQRIFDALQMSETEVNHSLGTKIIS